MSVSSAPLARGPGAPQLGTNIHLPRYRWHCLGGQFISPILVGLSWRTIKIKIPKYHQQKRRRGQGELSSPAAAAELHAESGGNRSRRTSSIRKRPVNKSSDEEGLPAPKLPTSRRGRRQTREASASQPRRDRHGRFVRADTPTASEAESDIRVTIEDPCDGGESAASLGSLKAELKAAEREQRKAVAADEVSEMT